MGGSEWRLGPSLVLIIYQKVKLLKVILGDLMGEVHGVGYV